MSAELLAAGPQGTCGSTCSGVGPAGAAAALAHVLLVAVSFAGVAALAAAQGLARENLAWVVYVHVLTASVALEAAGVRLARGEGPRGAPGGAAADVLGRVLWVFVEIAACGALGALAFRF
jgi:hypothetical protein